jgi:predicted O-methyltransferase YrrM
VPGTSVTLEEAVCLCAIARHLHARRILEIGTFDGNTALALAANLEDGGGVTTVDLPRDFDPARDRTALAIEEPINLTSRDRVGAQFRNHPLASRVRQVFGDSATLDWKALGGPFDLVFIDGCHDAAYVDADTRHAMEVLATPGAVVWHDYGQFRDVSTVVDRIARETRALDVFAIAGTRLAVGIRRATS